MLYCTYVIISIEKMKFIELKAKNISIKTHFFVFNYSPLPNYHLKYLKGLSPKSKSDL